MSLLSEIIAQYNKESLNEDPTFEDDIEESDVNILKLPHVPGSDVFVLSTSWSSMCGDCESNIMQIQNLKSVGEYKFDLGENYSVATHMYTKIDKSKKAGILISAQNAETDEYYTLFEG